MHQLEDGGRHVDGPDKPADDTRWALSMRELEDERNVQSRVVYEKAVLIFAMLTQRLAVIRQQDDERAIVQAALAEIIKESRKLAIRIGHFAVIQASGVLAVEGLWRIIRTVRIVEM